VLLFTCVSWCEFADVPTASQSAMLSRVCQSESEPCFHSIAWTWIPLVMTEVEVIKCTWVRTVYILWVVHSVLCLFFSYFKLFIAWILECSRFFTEQLHCTRPYKRHRLARHWWVTPIILATQEAEIRRNPAWSQLRQIVHEFLSQKHPTHKSAGGVAQVGERLLKPQYHFPPTKAQTR
jgi:hypothetical protein